METAGIKGATTDGSMPLHEEPFDMGEIEEIQNNEASLGQINQLNGSEQPQRMGEDLPWEQDEISEIEEKLVKTGTELSSLTRALAAANSRTDDQRQRVEKVKDLEKRIIRVRQTVVEELEFYRKQCDEYEPKTDFVYHASEMGVEQLKTLVQRTAKIETKFEEETLPPLRDRILRELLVAKDEVEDIRRRVELIKEEEAEMSRRKQRLQRRIEETRWEAAQMRHLTLEVQRRAMELRRQADLARRQAAEAHVRADQTRRAARYAALQWLTVRQTLSDGGIMSNRLLYNFLVNGMRENQERHNEISNGRDNVDNELGEPEIGRISPSTMPTNSVMAENHVIDSKEIECVVLLSMFLTGLHFRKEKKETTDEKKKKKEQENQNKKLKILSDAPNPTYTKAEPDYRRPNSGPLNERIWQTFFSIRQNISCLEDEIRRAAD